LEIIDATRERLTVDLTVTNISTHAVGWDSEFGAGITFMVFKSDKDEKDVETKLLAGRQQDCIEQQEIERVPEAERLLRSRFVELSPGKHLTKRIRLTDRIREWSVQVLPPANAQGPMTSRGSESFYRYRFPEEIKVVVLGVEYSVNAWYFWESYGVWPREVMVWHGGVVRSNWVKGKFAD
jgi:hypothetical protein